LSVVSEYPLWLTLLSFLLGAVYAFSLYYREKKLELSKRLLWVLIFFRFLTISLISFLLLSPLIKRNSETIEKPVIVIGVDNSESLVLIKDSTYYHNEFPGQIAAFIKKLQEKFEVRVYSFGDKLSRNFNGQFPSKQTDISSFWTEIETRYSNCNIGAIIIATDGIYNHGSDPFYAAQKITFPIYTVALGDTLLNKDIILKKTIFSKTVYKGDSFPLEIWIELNKCEGASTIVRVKKGAQELFKKEIRSTEEKDRIKIPVLLQALENGMQRYTICVDPMPGEASETNNAHDIFIEVLDSRQKIALLYGAPHPDIMAFQQALDGSSRFLVDIFHVSKLPLNLDQYDLIILNQLPSIAGVSNLAPVFSGKSSLLFILGSQTDYNAFNNLKTGLVVSASRSAFIEAQAISNPGFSLFTMESKEIPVFQDLPPLLSPFGAYQFGPLTDALFYQKIGAVSSRLPLIMFLPSSEKKIGVIAGENLWRWRLSNYIQQSNHETFDRLINKIVQYLSVKADKSFFRINVNPRIQENEAVEFNAEVYNAAYELINKPDVNLVITDKNNNNFPFIFGKTDKAYFLNAGQFPVGEYTYSSSVTVGKNTYTKSGSFAIVPLNVEALNLLANHNLLYRIAQAHDGQMVHRDELNKLFQMISTRQDIHSVSTVQKRYSDLIGNPWLFLFILGLLTAEWATRKRYGA